MNTNMRTDMKETIYDFFKEVCKTKEEYTYLKNKVDSVVLRPVRKPVAILIDAHGCSLENEIKNAKPDPNAYKYLLWKTFARPYFAKYVYLPKSDKDIFFGEKRNLSNEEIKNRQALIKRIFRKKFLWIFEL